MTTTTYAVKGMTCEHCVRAVTAELSQVAGVTGVEIDLATGRATITSEGPVDESAVRAAVDEAGYEIVE
jgi:copper chaperone